MSDNEYASERTPSPEPEDEPAPEEEEYREPTPPPPKKEEVREAPKPKKPPMQATETGGMSEAAQMMEDKRRKDKERMEAEIREYEEQRKEEKEKLECEICELKEKREKRKAERAEENRRLEEQRIIEDQKRRAEEDERQRKKKEEAEAKLEEREKKRLEAEERAKNMGKRSFVIHKKGKSEGDVEEERKEESVKSKEQLEAEKKAILEQRIAPLGDIDNMDEAQLKEKAKEIFQLLFRLESDKYDLEQQFKQRQYEMQELADRARQMNKGKKKMAVSQEPDPMAEKYTGIPPKIQLCSKYERHTDRRTYVERKVVFHGPNYAEETPRIKPGEGYTAQAGGEGEAAEEDE